VNDEERNVGGRPKKKVRPEIRLSHAYVSKIGAECGDMFDTVSKCASAVLSVDALAARELSVVAERLAQMKAMFQ
jgi:hypothetical protein